MFEGDCGGNWTSPPGGSLIVGVKLIDGILAMLAAPQAQAPPPPPTPPLPEWGVPRGRRVCMDWTDFAGDDGGREVTSTAVAEDGP
eukprot:CAMPEP_0195033620 /NCGR_PEP_ID=MMETSP0326_2-20130528/65983_1 /TAXON_ID=2866 ORGANISM="Crypthecodinium cohnii, Strain Seligo" /NCGR_SAMPLE_ID=MMETSP0326_2 /ASSEMBLY_ACC=CAM_ASM_000348 /LENGTH=85 /DNA_ID=CAMNT_0040058117 /DNA_START=80 /DNA_END=333 /DNA_ORIENTATION=+